MIKLEVLRFENHVPRQGVYDLSSKRDRDIVIFKGAILYKIIFFNRFAISWFGLDDEKDQEEKLKEARDFSVQETQVTEVAALVRDSLLSSLSGDHYWDLLNQAAGTPAKDGIDRILKINLEPSLRGYEITGSK